MNQLVVPERMGIYLFLLPNLKVGYVGSSNNLKRRYEEHTSGLGNKTIKSYMKQNSNIEYMVLEYCDGYKNKDLKIIEEFWINHFQRKGLNLINVSRPTKEVSYYESKPILVYDARTLEFIEEFDSVNKAAKKLKISGGSISHSIIENLSKIYKRRFIVKGYFFFFKENFSEEMLYEKQKRFFESKKTRRLGQKEKFSKKILQFSKEGKLIEKWNSLMDAERSLNISNENICNCLKGKGKTAGGYIWKYAEESELENESVRLQNF